eukprot:scaffold20268_cov64-Cyclotella_meneghiniana.AAC.13
MMETAIRRVGLGKINEAAVTEECIGILKKVDQAYKMRQERIDQMEKSSFTRISDQGQTI